MQKFNTLQDAIELARYAHRNQLDKAGMPYFEHPYRVMQAVQGQGGMPYVQAAAVLHDVTEDTSFSLSMLIQLGFSPAAVLLVGLLDRGESRERYLGYNDSLSKAELDALYYEDIRKNPAARMIKLADIADNLQPWRLSYLPDDTQERLQNKYLKAKELLGV